MKKILNSTKFNLKQGPQLSPFQERLKETDFYTKPVEEKFENTRSVKVSDLETQILRQGIFRLFLSMFRTDFY